MTSKDFLTMDDFDPAGRTVLVRVDINAAIEHGRVQDSERLEAHGETIKELAEKGAKVVILAHQGRAGDKDYARLEQHANILSKHVGRKVKYVPDLSGKTTLAAIRKLTPGKIILLENVRMYAEEGLDGKKMPFEKALYVQELSSVCDVYVNDAFSAAHRAQTSLMGFCRTLPSYAGRVLQREYDAVLQATAHAKRPVVQLLGGGKPDEPLGLMQYALEHDQADKILTSGVLGELCLMAKGKKLGRKETWLKEQGYLVFLPKVQELMKKYEDRIDVPGDFAYADEHGIRVEVKLEQLPDLEESVFDIGTNTARAYGREIASAKTVYLKGPLGAYEQKAFELGTRMVMQAMMDSKAFTLLGGGHTITALQKFGFPFKKFGHVSLAGGALLEMLQGKPLPAVEALKEAARKIGYAQNVASTGMAQNNAAEKPADAGQA
ncbi:phosphoglycerate kinase [Candidatus Micrarchaeota archaeon]|nr:phosphoglycerate kinase [Candidatus Micrarchaeota archaeon]